MLRSCSMVWNVDVPYLNVWGNPLPITAVPENANTTNVTSLQSVWLIEYHGSQYNLIKGNRKIILKKNCNNPAFVQGILHLQVWNAAGMSTTTSYDCSSFPVFKLIFISYVGWVETESWVLSSRVSMSSCPYQIRRTHKYHHHLVYLSNSTQCSSGSQLTVWI